MVLQRKLYYGLIDYQAPATPRASRSARARRAYKKNIGESQMRAFELLATVAGKLLLEGESSINSAIEHDGSKSLAEKETVSKGHQDKQKLVKAEPCEQESSDEAIRASKIQKLSPKIKFKELSRKSTFLRQHNLVAVKSETPEKSYSVTLSAELVGKVEDKSSISSGDCGVQRDSIASVDSPVTKVGDGIPSPEEIEHENAGNNRSVADLFCSEDPMDLDSKSPTLVSSGSSVEVPSPGNFSSPNKYVSNYVNETKHVDRDDDENSSRCTQPSTIYSKGYRPQYVEDRRIRKVLASSKFWKPGSGLSLGRGGEFSRTGNEVKTSYHRRKMSYTHQRTHKSYFKRRKLFERKSTFLSDTGIRRKTGIKSSRKDIKEEAGDDSMHKLEDYQVKFSIKSFKVPELYIEMPGTATIGDLKRTVLETVNAILRNGLTVGVIVQGKKVKDDNKTLFQSGLFEGGKPDGLGFCLEPSTQPTPQLACPENGPTELLDQGDSYKPISWLPASESALSVVAPDPSSPSITTSNNIGNNLKLTASASDNTLSDVPSPDSKALVPVSAVKTEALAVIPIQRKSNRSESVQRRIRRPFSVAEVEALVLAVEILGTGRWRDVKVRAFENANHRTYVDLKDKWKTLVHTARISPHQRRGEPVPQELLDRVLSAHAYWSQQQAKLQVKQQQPPPPVPALPAQALPP